MSIRLALFALGVAALTACSQHQSPSPASNPTQTPAGSRNLRVAHFVDYADSMRIFAPTSPTDTTPRAIGKQWFAENLTTESGKPAIILTKRSGAGNQLFTDTLAMLRDGLRPLWEHMRFAGTLKDIRYDGARVHQTTFSHDTLKKTLDKEFLSAPFGFNQLEMAMRSLPLRTGFRTTLPLYSEGDDSVEVDTVTVLGLKAGPPAAWMIRFADPAIVSTYTLDTASRRIIAQDVTSRKTGGRFWMRHQE